ncbi:MAG: IS1634 family transposase [Thermoplasmataceae archaeon]
MPEGKLELTTERIESMPVINHFMERLGLDMILSTHMPEGRSRISHSTTLAILLRNLTMQRIPVYGIQEWASMYRHDLFGIESGVSECLNDDRVGRALDALFDSDRGSMLTQIVVGAVKEFHISMDEFHNDSTTITLSGDYEDADGSMKRGKESLKITYGHNKDHRHDLKQILWILTVASDGAVPVHYKATDGNVTDNTTHIETWEAIKSIAGKADFLYVVDSKLCTTENMSHIDRNKGRFLTVMPQNRREDGWFRKYVNSHDIEWKGVRRSKNGADGRWKSFESPMRSAENYRIVWIWSSQKQKNDSDARQSSIEKGIESMDELKKRLQSPKCRIKTREGAIAAARKAIGDAGRWIDFELKEDEIKRYKQTTRGRPSRDKEYRRVTRITFSVEWKLRDQNIAFDEKCDGIFPLITNTDLSASDLLNKYKIQSRLEKRHQQLKSVYEITPVSLKSVTRIEGLLFLYFIVLLMEALMEREVRRGMKREKIASLPIYPEGRACESPTSSRMLELFDNIEVHHLLNNGEFVRTFFTGLNEKQKLVLRLLNVSEEKYTF